MHFGYPIAIHELTVPATYDKKRPTTQSRPPNKEGGLQSPVDAANPVGGSRNEPAQRRAVNAKDKCETMVV